MPTLYTTFRAQHHHSLPRTAAPDTKVKRGSKAQPLLAAAHPNKKQPPRNKKRIAVIGAGFAGLCAAYELQALQYDVTVYEARSRVGGRAHSLNIKSIGDDTIEGGGELIGSNHPLWNAYQRKFGLKFTDAKDYGNSPVRMDGTTLSFEKSQKYAEKLDVIVKQLTDLAETIEDPYEPWINRNAKRLDRRSIGGWIRSAPAHRYGKQALRAMLEADNGVVAGRQSLLGVLAMVKGGGLDRYWNDTEVYRCAGGNDQLAKKFQARLDKRGRVVFLEHRAVAVRKVWHEVKAPKKSGKKKPNRGEKSREVVELDLQVRRAGKWRILQRRPHFDRVILAVPPSVWDRIKFETKVPKMLKNPPSMGANVKFLIGLKKRVWEDFSSSPNLTEDGPVNITWETTEANKKPNYAMVAFSGARDAVRLSKLGPDGARREVLGALKVPYPRLQDQVTGGKFMNWPKEKWTKCSYYFPRCGDVTKWGPLWHGGYKDWLEFAGEHTCFAFMGYMEGALASGFRLARRLAVRDGVLSA